MNTNDTGHVNDQPKIDREPTRSRPLRVGVLGCSARRAAARRLRQRKAVGADVEERLEAALRNVTLR